jgi:hypothetical protein
MLFQVNAFSPRFFPVLTAQILPPIDDVDSPDTSGDKNTAV